jgi:hypothetical protein
MARHLSLRDIDPIDDLLSRLRLDHTARRAGALIVEGPTDQRLLAEVLARDPRGLFPVGGRNNVLECARRIAAKPMCGVVCVADRDFDEDEGNWPNAALVVFFDEADLEAMLFASPALGRLLGEFASDDKLQAEGGVAAVRARARDAVREVSAARSVNAQHRLGLCFADVDLRDYIEKKHVTIKMGSLMGRLCAQRPKDRPKIEAEMSSHTPHRCPHTGNELARGRDLLDIIDMLLRATIGNMKHQQLADDFVERMLRLTARSADLASAPFLARLSQAVQASACSTAS